MDADQGFFSITFTSSLFDLIVHTGPANTEATMAVTSFPPPTPEDTEDLLLTARYGELDDLKSFIEKFGAKPLTDARDEDGNTILHMVCGNGHLGAADSPRRRRCSNVHLRIRSRLDLLDYLVPDHIPPSFATVQNSSAGSTPLHWATLNKQLDVVKRVVKLCGTWFNFNGFGNTRLSKIRSRRARHQKQKWPKPNN